MDAVVGESKNECDSTRNGDAVNSGDEDSNHRCEVIETKPVSLGNISGGVAGGGGGGGGGHSNDSSNNSMDIARYGLGLGDLGGGSGMGMGGGGGGGGNGLGGGNGSSNAGGSGWDMLHLGRLREAFGNNGGGNHAGTSGFLNGIFANALGGGGGGAAGKMNSFMAAAAASSGGGGGGFHGGGGGGFPSPGPSGANPQLPGIAQSFSNAPAWATGSMDMSNLFRNRTQFR